MQSTSLAPRLRSLDVYRGFVMLLMMGEVISLGKVDQAVGDSAFWGFLHYNQSHVEWAGCSLHDMIQPSFSFLVGAAMPFSLASRINKGQGFGKMFGHVIVRSLILIFLGIFLRSMHAKSTYFTFEDTLTQIGLGYSFLFLVARCSVKMQVAALSVLLILYWLAFALYPLPGDDFNFVLAGTSREWEHNLSGFAAHWNKNTNLAWAFDQWFLNLFPREKVFRNNGGGYATLSFIPTLGTMILGLLSGNLLKSPVASAVKIRKLLIIGSILLVISAALHFTGINPIVKRIWTPAWTLFSGGICYYFLAFFYFTNDVKMKNTWSFPLMVIGMNSIAAYVMAETIARFIASSLQIHLGPQYDTLFGLPYRTLVSGFLILSIQWFILYRMYKKGVFIRI
ncbi:MAG: DUF5009 domain-containing protein [Chitinophagaceae bacterium]